MQHTDKVTIAIVDDHPVVIEGLRALLANEKYMDTVSFTSGAGVLAFAGSNDLNVVLLDINLPDMNGIEICKALKRAVPDVLVLALSNQAERSIIMQMLQQGASGYILKNAGADEILQCINAAMKGELAFSNEVKDIMARPSPRQLQTIPSLSKREKQILQMIADGETTQQIAGVLFLSPFTVETHRRNLLQKMQVKNVAELIRQAVSMNLL